MGKVSIGLRGWRFDEEDVFTESGEFKPLEELKPEIRDQLVRLTNLVGSPCSACWLIHGDENLADCNVASAVYGETMHEVVLCDDHEQDFVYWFREAGGSAYAGEEAMQDEFYGWFADGGRAPEGFEGLEHVDTDPTDLPDPPEPDLDALREHYEEEKSGRRIDLRDVDLSTEYPRK